jgi:LPS-assembly lipoprotein
MNRVLKPLLLLPVLALVACGFHLRGNAALPQGMERVHLTVNGGGDLQRKVARALLASNVTVEKDSGTGIAELSIPIQTFTMQILTVNGVAEVTEYAIHYHVQFTAKDGEGKTIIPGETVDMQREYSYDVNQPVGTQAQVEAIQDSLVDDTVQAILFRLQAVRRHGEKAAEAAAGTAAPASAASAMNSSPQIVPSTTIP